MDENIELLIKNILDEACQPIKQIGDMSWIMAAVKSRLSGRSNVKVVIGARRADIVNVLQALQLFSGEEIMVSSLLSLLCATFDENYQSKVHPSFVVILKQLSDDELRILRHVFDSSCLVPLITLQVKVGASGGRTDFFRHFSCLHKELGLASYNRASDVPVLLDNLSRLKLIEIHEDRRMTDDEPYAKILADADFAAIKDRVKLDDGMEWNIRKMFFDMTDFGAQFCKVCFAYSEIVDKTE